MAVTVFKTFSAGEVLTAADLNSSLTRITSNGEDLGWPATKAKDFNANRLILDADADSSFTVDTDDRLDLELQGFNAFIWNGTAASSVNGISWFTSATGNNVYMLANGTDSNVSLEVRSKGTGKVILADDSGNEILIAADVASAVTEVTITNATTGNGPTIAPTGETNVDLNITARGTGLVKIGDGMALTKGGDISSASPLVLGTDGNYFDVTGTTNFAVITVAAGTEFMLQFDGVLTITHGSTMDLPGEVNFTTAAGDRMICFAQAANDVQVLSISKADGTAVVAAAAANILSPNNHALSVTQNGTVLTVALKTQDGGDAASSDKVILPFDDGDGTTTYSEITGALSAALTSGSTVGCTNDVAFRLWYVALFNSGTPQIGIVKTTITTVTTVNTMSLHHGLQTLDSTAEGGSGAADAAQIVYAPSTLSNQSFIILGYSDWDSGLSAVGAWDANPSRTVLYHPGVPRPGDILQTVVTVDGADATTTTDMPNDASIPQNTEGAQFMSRTITPLNHSNVLEINVGIMMSSTAQNSNSALFQDSIANALAAGMVQEQNSKSGTANYKYIMAAGSVSEITYKVRAGAEPSGATLTFNGNAGSSAYGDATESSSITVTEKMG